MTRNSKRSVKLQTWVEPEIAEALDEWRVRFEERAGMTFTSPSEALRAFLNIHLSLLLSSKLIPEKKAKEESNPREKVIHIYR